MATITNQEAAEKAEKIGEICVGELEVCGEVECGFFEYDRGEPLPFVKFVTKGDKYWRVTFDFKTQLYSASVDSGKGIPILKVGSELEDVLVEAWKSSK